MGTQLDFDGCPSPVRHRDDGADFGIDKPDPISFAPHADCKTLLIPSFSVTLIWIGRCLPNPGSCRHTTAHGFPVHHTSHRSSYESQPVKALKT
jgi:hypothetical protein